MFNLLTPTAKFRSFWSRRVNRLLAATGRTRAVNSTLLETLEGRQLLAAISWDGGGDGSSWNDSRNWSADVLPTAADDVAIAIGSPLNLDLGGGTVSARSILGLGSVELRNGSLRAADRFDWSASGDARIAIAANLRAPAISLNSGASGFTLITGSLDASSLTGAGGVIHALGDRVAAVGATIDTSGLTGGGEILFGGNYLGRGPQLNSKATFVDSASAFRADATGEGNGGRIIVWSDDQAAVYGSLSARGSGSGTGGFVETSALGSFDVNPASVDVAGGTWLVDPTNITISVAGGTSNGAFNSITGQFTPDPFAISANVSTTAITNALNSGTDVIIYTRNPGAAALGNITVSGVLSTTAALGPATLTLRAANNIIITGTITSTGPLSLVLEANNGTGPLGFESNDDFDPTAGDISLTGTISLAVGTAQLSGVNLTISGTSSIIASGGTINANFTGTLNLPGQIRAATVNLNSGIDGTGDLNSSAVINADNLTLRAGDASGSGSTAALNIATATFRNAAGAALSRPNSVTLQQDASITSSGIPTLSRYGSGNISGMTLNLRSWDGSVDISSSSGLNTSLLTISSLTGGTLSTNIDLAQLNLGSLGTFTLSGGSITSSGPATFVAPLLLAADTSITASGALGLSRSINGSFSLSLTGSGVIFTQSIGGTQPLSSLIAQATSGTLTMAGSVTTINAQGYSGSSITLGSPGASFVSTNAGGIAFSGPIGLNGDASIQTNGSLTFASTITNNFTLFLNGGGSTTFGGAVNIFALDNQRSGVSTISSDQTVTTNLSYAGPVTLSGNVVITSGPTTFAGTINSASGGALSLTINSDAPVTLADIGTSFALSSFTSDTGPSGTLTVGSIRTRGDITLLDQQVTLAGNLYDTTGSGAVPGGNFASTNNNPGLTVLANNVTVTTGSGQLRFNSEVQSLPGLGAALTVSSSAFTIFGGSVGGQAGLGDDKRLGSLTASGPVTFGNAGASDARALRTAGNVTFNGALSLADHLTIDTTPGLATANVLFSGTVNANAAGQPDRELDIVNSGSVVFNADVGNTFALGSIQTDGYAGGPNDGSIAFRNVSLTGRFELGDDQVTLNGTYATTASSGPFRVLGATTLTGNTTVNWGTSEVYFGSTINADIADIRNLTLQSAGQTILAGLVGNTTRLGDFNSDGVGSISSVGITTRFGMVLNDAAAVIQGTFQGTGAIVEINGAITLVGNTTVATGADLFLNTVNGPFDLTVNPGAQAVFSGPTGSITPLNSLTSNASFRTRFANNSASANSITIAGPLELTGTVTLNTTGGPLSLLGTVSGAGSSLNLAGSGDTTFADIVFIVNLSNQRTGTSFVAADQFTFGSLSHAGPVVLTADVSFTGTTDLTFESTINSDGAPRSLTLKSDGLTDLRGSLGATAALGSVESDASGSLAVFGVTSTGSQTFNDSAISLRGTYNTGNSNFTVNGPVVLTGQTTITTGIAGVAFNGTIDGNPSPADIVINAASAVNFNGAIGSNSPIGFLGVSTSSDLFIGAVHANSGIGLRGGTINQGPGTVTANNAIQYNGPVVVAGSVNVISAVESIVFESTINGAGDLTLSAGGVVSIAGDVGSTNPLSTLSSSANHTFLRAGVTTSGNQTYAGSLSLTSGATYNASTGSFVAEAQPGISSIDLGGFGLTTIVADVIYLSGDTFATSENTLVLFSSSLASIVNNNGVMGSISSDGPGSFEATDSAVVFTGSQFALNNSTVTLNRSLLTTNTANLFVPGTLAFNNDNGSLPTTGLRSAAGWLFLGSAAGVGASTLTLSVAELFLSGSITGAAVQIAPVPSSNRSISLGTDGVGGNLNLSQTELSNIQTDLVTIGSADFRSLIVVSGPINLARPNELRAEVAPGSININADITVASTGSLTTYGSGSTTHLNANIITDGADVIINDALRVDGFSGARVIDTTNGGSSFGIGSIIITGTVDAEYFSSIDLALTAGLGDVILSDLVGGDAVTRLLNFSATGAVVSAVGIAVDSTIFLAGSTENRVGGNFQAGAAVTLSGPRTVLTADVGMGAAGGAIALNDLYGNEPGFGGPHNLLLVGGGFTTLNFIAGVNNLTNLRNDLSAFVNNQSVLGNMYYAGPVTSASDGQWDFSALNGDMTFAGGFIFVGQDVNFHGTGNTTFGLDSSFRRLNLQRQGTLNLPANLSSQLYTSIASDVVVSNPAVTISAGAEFLNIAGNISGLFPNSGLILNSPAPTTLGGALITLETLESDTTSTPAGDFEFTNPNAVITLGQGGLTIRDPGTVTLRGQITSTQGSISLIGGGTTILQANLTTPDTISILGNVNVQSNAAGLFAANFDLSDTITGSGTLSVGPSESTRVIELGNSYLNASALHFDQTFLNRIQMNAGSGLVFGSQSQSGDIVLNSQILVSNNVTFLAPIAPAQIIVNASPIIAPGGSLTFTGSGNTLILNADLITDGAPITINDSVIIEAPAVTIDTTNTGFSPGAAITINGTINSGAFFNSNLTLNAGSNPVALNGNIGGTVPLDNLTINASSPTTIGGDVTTIGNQLYQAPTTVTGSFILRSTGEFGLIFFGSTLSLAPFSTVTTQASEVDFLGSVSGDGARLIILPRDPSQDIVVAGPENSADLEVSQTELNQFSSSLDDVQIGGTDGTANLLVDDATIYTDTTFAMAGTGGGIRINNIKPGTANTGIIVRGSQATTELFGSIITRGGFITINDAIRIIGPNAVIDSTDGGIAPTGAPVDIDFNINSFVNEFNNLNIDSGNSNVIIDGSVGVVPGGELGQLIINGQGGITLNAPAINTAGDQSYTGPVIVDNTTTVSTDNAPVVFNGDIGGTGTLIIAPNTGETTFTGEVTSLAILIVNGSNIRTFSQPVDVGQLILTGGTVFFNAATSINSADISSGIFAGTGDVTFSGPVTWSGGEITGTGGFILAESATLLISGPDAKFLARNLQTSGTVTWAEGDIELSGSSITITPTGSFIIESGSTLFGSGGGETFENQGTLIKRASNAAGANFDALVFTNSGTVIVEAGELAITPTSGVLVNSGLFDIRSAGTLVVTGDLIFEMPSQLRVELAGPSEGEYGVVFASGLITTNGHLDVRVADGFVPEVSHGFDVLRSLYDTSRPGNFPSISGPTFGSRSVSQTGFPGRLQVRFGGSIDVNGDGVLDLTDLEDFFSNFYTNLDSPAFDFNGDGSTNLEDLSEFVTAFYASTNPSPSLPATWSRSIR
jgi:mucin-19